jgi:hypothetical protein
MDGHEAFHDCANAPKNISEEFVTLAVDAPFSPIKL